MVSEQLRRGTVSTADLQSTNWLRKAMTKKDKIGTISQPVSTENLGALTHEFLKNTNIVKVMCRT